MYGVQDAKSTPHLSGFRMAIDDGDDRIVSQGKAGYLTFEHGSLTREKSRETIFPSLQNKPNNTASLVIQRLLLID